eukprot:PhF_6_TR39649/c0_g1_i2/m.58813
MFIRCCPRYGRFAGLNNVLGQSNRNPGLKKFVKTWIRRERHLDSDIERFNLLCLELHPSYKVASLVVSVVVCLPVFMLQLMDIVTFSKIMVACNITTEEALEEVIPENEYICYVAYFVSFLIWAEGSNYFRMPLYIHYMAPFWRRKGWVRAGAGQSALGAKTPTPTPSASSSTKSSSMHARSVGSASHPTWKPKK